MPRVDGASYAAGQEESHVMSTSTAVTFVSFAIRRAALVAASLVLAGGVLRAQDDQLHANHGGRPAPAKLVQIVRESTRQYVDLNVATTDGYGQFLGCVSGPQEGAMGFHYVNGARVGDGLIDATKPEALIYEVTGGKARFVGVEFIVDAAQWNAVNAQPPVLEGQSFHFVGAPNRYGIPAFYELHVWAWRDNPGGAFADFNTRVTCSAQ